MIAISWIRKHIKVSVRQEQQYSRHFQGSTILDSFITKDNSNVVNDIGEIIYFICEDAHDQKCSFNI